MRHRTRIAELQAELDAANAVIADLQFDYAHYQQVVADHNALYNLLEDAGVKVWSDDGITWSYVSRGVPWSGYASAVDAVRAGLLRLLPR